MADNAEFQIKIRTDLEGQGLKQTKEEFQSIQKETAAANEQLKQTVVTHEEVGEKGQEAGQKTKHAAEEAGVSHRELREVIRSTGESIGAQIPMLGLWLNETTAAVGGVLIAIEAIKNAFEQLQAPVDAFNASLLALDSARMEALATAASDASTEMADLAASAAKLDAAYRTGTTAMENRIKLYNQQRDDIVKVQEAEERAFEAELEHRVALGQLDAQEAERKKEAARLALDSSRGAQDAAKLQNEINERQKEFEQARIHVISGSDERAVKNAEKDEREPKATADEKKQAVTNAQKQPIQADVGTDGEHFIETYQSEDEAKKRAQEFRDLAQGNEENGDNEGAASFREMAKAIDDAVKSQKSYIDNLQKEADAANAAVVAAKAQADIAKDRKTHDEEINRTGADAIKALQDQLDEMKATQARVQAANASASGSRQATAGVNADNEAFGQAQALEHKLENGPGLTNAEMHRLADLFHRLHALVEAGQITDQALKNKINELEAKTNQLEQWHQSQNTRS